MLAYTMAQLANALMFVGLFGASFLLNTDENNTQTETEAPRTDDGFPEHVAGDATDNLLTTMDPDGANFKAGNGDDSIVGTDADDTLLAGTGDDTAEMGAGDDRVLAKAGDDSIAAGDGNDTLFGGDGADSLSGDAGDDNLNGGDDDDDLFGGTGDDVLWGFSGDDTLFGGGGADSLNGASGDRSTLEGGGIDGIDNLFGGDGADSLILGAGDQGTGGAGADIFGIDQAVADQGTAEITDFDAKEDQLEIEYSGITDPETDEPVIPTLSVINFEDGTGASIALNGVVVAKVTGAADLDPALINLIAA